MTKKEEQEINDLPVPDHHTVWQIQLDDKFYSKTPEALENMLQELNAKLQTVGIVLSADDYTILKLDLNEEKFQSVTMRRAGRKKKNANKMLDEIHEYLKTHTMQECADWLGISRQTFYRKMKAHKEAGDKKDTEF